LLCACGSGGNDESFGLTEREFVTGPLLSFQSPMLLANAGDGTGRVFVVERAGTVQVFDGDAGVTASEVFLDIRSRVMTGGERGLFSIAFHPSYASNGLFYVHYSAPTSTPGRDQRSVVGRYRV